MLEHKNLNYLSHMYIILVTNSNVTTRASVTNSCY